MDVLVLSSCGYFYSVAILGTAFSDFHLKILLSETDILLFCFDGDIAGQKASLRALRIILKILYFPKRIYFFSLPEGYDPDSYVRKVGLFKFVKYAKNSYSISSFLLNYLKKGKKHLSEEEGGGLK